MKRFIALIALAGVVGMSFGAVPRSSGETGYVPKPTFTISRSRPLLPGYEFKLVGLEWITWKNESSVPCHVVLYPGTTFSVECTGASKSLDGDLETMPAGKGKEYIYVIKEK